MSEHEDLARYTVNNSEIRHPRERLTAGVYHNLVHDLGLVGDSPAERMESFRTMSVEDVAELLDMLNQQLQGSDETLLADSTMKVGGKPTVPLEHRYDLFESIVSKLQNAPKDINPARIGDALGLLVVILHPFHDGNGRTARMVGYAFQHQFDTDELEGDFAYFAQSRETAQGNRPYAYIPILPEGDNRTEPSDIETYFDEILYSDRSDLYTGPFSGIKKASPRTVDEASSL